jgi:hypothetical protein
MLRRFEEWIASSLALLAMTLRRYDFTAPAVSPPTM